ncbi:TonB-dependent siderophore receptor [Cyanobacterium aponinum]|uniref:TonB-dependent siderophore receptor n=1 Tax=Cyanobacterium aponinum 0216 TaxID=2676140 RepID=A0A844GQD6_9CHRO|nr:TonB-dependent siderophore receptor [Cyanobacterium aponinum]MTF38697.1 TonB-dependent siderophore receptor [Cyanobacterium aponinum 0216]
MQKQQKTILFFSLLSVILGGPVYADGLGTKAEREILLNNEAVESISQASVVQVTGVQINPTPEGIEVILEVINGQIQADDIRQEGNTLLINIPNAVLTLPDTQEFEQSNPIPEIELVRVISLPTEQVQVAITGSEAPPTAQVNIEAGNLVLTVTPTASAVTEEPQDTIEVVATQEQQEETGYNVPDSTTATRTDTPIRDIPANVQVVPQQVLQEQKVFRLQDALRNVSGVTFSDSFGDRFSRFQSRGFRLEQFKNGFRDGFNSSRAALEFSNVERLEVIKGPASVLYGQVEPGGLVNVITKKPLFEPYYAAEFTIGSYSFYRPSFDISGPLNEEKTVAYRLNVAYENAGSFRDFVNSERVSVAPVLTWKVGENTTLTFEGEYLYDRRPMDLGLVAMGDRPADLPFRRALFGPQRPGYDYSEWRGYAYLDHQFNENLALRTGFRITSVFEGRNAIIAGGSVQEDGRTLPMIVSAFNQFYETFTLQNDLIGKFNTGSVSHQILFGLELAKETGFFPAEGDEFASGATLDIFNPDYDSIFFDDIQQGSRNFSQRTNRLGIYLQDQITLLDNLKLLIGGRFDTVESANDFSTDQGELETTNNEAFSPRVGIVYQPIPEVSLYASFSQSFAPRFGRSADNSVFEPERGTQYEVGVKADLLDGRLSSTLSLFDITKSNILTTDPDNPDFSVQVGEQQSSGVEFNIVGEILPGWNIIAGYAYTDAKITKDNTFPEGNRLPRVPYNSANLWTTYEIQKGNLTGLKFGAGVFFVGNRTGDLNNTFEIPSYARVDAGIFYTRDNFQAALNIKNLFDTRYFEGADSRRAILPGAPLTVLGTISVKF